MNVLDMATVYFEQDRVYGPAENCIKYQRLCPLILLTLSSVTFI